MSKKIYVGNLSFKMGYEELKKLFEPFGEIEESIVIVDKFTNISKGFGFVTFVNDADADKAVAEINNKEVEGRALKVNEARPKRDDQPRTTTDNKEDNNKY